MGQYLWRGTLAAGDAVLVAYDGQQPFRARHVAQPRVRAINVTVTANAVVRDPRLASLIPKVEHPAGFEPVHPGPGLWQSLADWLQGARDGADALLAEGLALQLLARGARGGQCAVPASQVPLSRRDRQLVMRVRAHLERHPGETHSLAALAALACMSPSTLRDKFRLAYGCPVFEYLRECRLERARQHLRAGLGVQQAAIRVGYRHPSNFATAFRRRYGYSPREEI